MAGIDDDRAIREAEEKAEYLLSRRALGNCPACGAKLERLWPSTEDSPDEEFSYECGALVIRAYDGGLSQSELCGDALIHALAALNRDGVW